MIGFRLYGRDCTVGCSVRGSSLDMPEHEPLSF